MAKNFEIAPFKMSEALIMGLTEECNEYTKRFGLVLTPDEMRQLTETNRQVLQNIGRIDFGRGAIDRIAKEFCDSPYISQYNYVETMQELIEIFYYYKNETLDEIPDDELIILMKQYFDGECMGDIELLKDRNLEYFARNIRYGEQAYEGSVASERECFKGQYYEGVDE